MEECKERPNQRSIPYGWDNRMNRTVPVRLAIW